MEDTPLDAGATVGPYTIVRPLGRGANATVYLARREAQAGAPAREVALKLRRRGEGELDRRFLREFEALRGLSLPGVVQVHEAGFTDAWLWYAMRAVDGLPLRSWVEAAPDVRGRIERVLSVGPLVCDALAGIHRAGMIHRDLKPGNVLVDAQGQPHVLDFGVVRWFRGGDPLTGQGGLVGTLPFMAPEQIGGLPLDARADVFAVGLMLWEGIAGKRARPARPQEWLRIQCLERLRPLAVSHPQVPRALSHVIDRMTAFDPMDRPEAHEAAELLRACARGAVPAGWPHPGAWVGSAPAWAPAEPGQPIVRVLAGPSGSGRRRAAEQLRRRATLAGIRTLRGRCRVEQPGSAVCTWLEALLEPSNDEPPKAELAQDDVATLMEMWPHLPLHTTTPRGVDSPRDLVRACVRGIAWAAERTPLLLVLEDLDEADALTARVVEGLARARPAGLSMLATYDDRWAIRRGRRVVEGLVGEGLASVARMPDLDAREAAAVLAAVLPEGSVPPQAEPGSPLRAVELGWEVLAVARRERVGVLTGPAADAALVDTAIHRASWAAMGVDPNAFVPRGTLAPAGGDRWTLGPGARASALARLANRAVSARRLADALDRDPAAATRVAGARARARLLAGETSAALVPAAQAALYAEATGRTAEARTWLDLVDTLPREARGEAYEALRFPLALCRARVASQTGSERPRPDLVAVAAARASTPAQRAEVDLLRAELRRREGDARGALTRLLRLASAQAAAPPHVATEALLRAAEIRIELGQHEDAIPLLDRAAAPRAQDAEERRDRTDERAAVQVAQLRAEVAIARGDLEGALRLAREGATLAAKIGDAAGLARHYQRLGHASLLAGERAQAEEAATSARRLFQKAHARHAAAEAALHLGELALARGDAPTALRLAEEACTVGKRLGGPRLHGNALALLLEVAVVQGDHPLAERCFTENARLAAPTPAWRVAHQRWRRAWGDGGAEHLAPEATGYRAALLAIEHARTLVERHATPAAAMPALHRARQLARAGGFRELALYAEVVAGEVVVVSDATWARTLREGLASRWSEVCLCTLAIDAARTLQARDHAAATTRVQEFALRAEEQGHRPAESLAQRMLEVVGGSAAARR